MGVWPQAGRVSELSVEGIRGIGKGLGRSTTRGPELRPKYRAHALLFQQNRLQLVSFDCVASDIHGCGMVW